MTLPRVASHHREGGGFCNPWPNAELHGARGMLRWMLQRIRTPRRPDPPASSFPIVSSAFARPRAEPDALTLTWIGHSSWLVQIGGLNVLLDPVWSHRVSPVRFAGPARIVPPAVPFETLPFIDVVVLSHDHYDHLDDPTIRRVARDYGDARWATPLGLARWFAKRGIDDCTDYDWWQSGTLATWQGAIDLTAVPAQHFSGRGLTNRDSTLWCGWVMRVNGRSVFFAGDSGLHPEFGEIARRAGPFDAAIMPIGAYDPRWFMRAVHMNPEEVVLAISAMRDATGDVPTVACGHWGTFKLTDEPLDEPPRRMRDAWSSAGFPVDRLWVPRHGETLVVGHAGQRRIRA